MSYEKPVNPLTLGSGFIFEHKGKIRIRRLHPCFRSGLDNNFFIQIFI